MKVRMLPVFLILLAVSAAWCEDIAVSSPDSRLTITVTPDPLSYRVDFDGRPLMAESPLGLDLKGQASLEGAFKVIDTQQSSTDTSWKPLYGQWAEVPDRYNEAVIDLREKAKSRRKLRLTLRAYDEGAAFAYTIPEQDGLDSVKIMRENTRFHFTDNHRAWAVYSAQGEYAAVNIADIRPGCERPLTIEMKGGPALALGEARLVDFARMKFAPDRKLENCLISKLDGPAEVTLPYTTPWRYIQVAASPAQLLEKSYFILNLNDACALDDTSWIKPGKVIREVTLTTDGGKACADFAAAQNLQYIEFDAGWYGHEYDDASDATTVTVDPKRSKGPLDLQGVIDYARGKGIGVWLYVNRRALEKQIEEVLPLLESWGVSGVKYGFVQVGPQEWTDWLHKAIRMAADHHLMIDVHDEYRPTGYSRTWPNFMTQEGIRGNEEMPPPWHNAVLPFTRFLCGAGDYTYCWYSTRIKTSHAHQLAAMVAYYSPVQFVYWYDRPESFKGDAGTDFISQVPVTWDALSVPGGVIGEYAAVARRKGNEWYAGVLNARERRQLPLALDFLDAGVTYTAHRYADAFPEGGKPFEVTVTTEKVTREDTLTLDMAANGGQAIRFVPEN